MDIGEIPVKKEKLSALPENLYTVEYTTYNQFHKEALALTDSKEIKAAIFEKTNCYTTEFHYVGHFIKYVLHDQKTCSDGFLVTYLLYNETKHFFVHNTRFGRQAFLKTKEAVSPYIEIIKLNRYRLVKEWRKEFIQPFSLPITYLKPNHLKTK